MMRVLIIWLVASAIGVALVVLLPEYLFGDGELVRLSDRHGPTLSDGLGLLFILGGWLYFLFALWARRRAMQPPWAAFALVAAMLVGGAACVPAFAADRDGLGIALAVMAVAAQFGLAILARRA
jgi:hypothetical protein